MAEAVHCLSPAGSVDGCGCGFDEHTGARSSLSFGVLGTLHAGLVAGSDACGRDRHIRRRWLGCSDHGW